MIARTCKGAHVADGLEICGSKAEESGEAILQRLKSKGKNPAE